MTPNSAISSSASASAPSRRSAPAAAAGAPISSAAKPAPATSTPPKSKPSVVQAKPVSSLILPSASSATPTRAAPKLQRTSSITSTHSAAARPATTVIPAAAARRPSLNSTTSSSSSAKSVRSMLSSASSATSSSSSASSTSLSNPPRRSSLSNSPLYHKYHFLHNNYYHENSHQNKYLAAASNPHASSPSGSSNAASISSSQANASLKKNSLSSIGSSNRQSPSSPPKSTNIASTSQLGSAPTPKQHQAVEKQSAARQQHTVSPLKSASQNSVSATKTPSPLSICQTQTQANPTLPKENAIASSTKNSNSKSQQLKKQQPASVSSAASSHPEIKHITPHQRTHSLAATQYYRNQTASASAAAAATKPSLKRLSIAESRAQSSGSRPSSSSSTSSRSLKSNGSESSYSSSSTGASSTRSLENGTAQPRIDVGGEEDLESPASVAGASIQECQEKGRADSFTSSTASSLPGSPTIQDGLLHPLSQKSSSSRSHSRSRKSGSNANSKSSSASSLLLRESPSTSSLTKKKKSDNVFTHAWSWRIIFIISIIFRTYFSLSTSYIHPDEHFQGPESIADIFFGWATKKSWEFSSEVPARSYFVAWIVYGIPMYFMELLFSSPSSPFYCSSPQPSAFSTIGSSLASAAASYTPRYDAKTVDPLAILVGLRLTFSLGNWVLSDMAIERLTQSYEHKLTGLFFYATSYVSWTYQSHTFSNSVETVLLLWCLVIIYEFETTKPSFFARVWDSVLLGGLVAFGVFNRITFPAFLLIPGCRVIPFFLRHPISLITFVAAFFVTSGLAVYFDTICFSFYNSQSSSTFAQLPSTVMRAAAAGFPQAYQDWLQHGGISSAISYVVGFFSQPNSFGSPTGSKYVITPLNNLLYNLQADNLALHGIHSQFHHLLVNIPELLGPAVILLFSTRYFKTIPFQSAASGLIILSLVKHQEARFLLPIIPLLFCCLDFTILPKRFRRIFFTIWITFNVFMGVLMGILHQGGIISAQTHLAQLTEPSNSFLLHQSLSQQTTAAQQSPPMAPPLIPDSDLEGPTRNMTTLEDVEVATEYVILWWKTYSPPIWMLGKPSKTVNVIDPIEGIPGGGENWDRYEPIFDYVDSLFPTSHATAAASTQCSQNVAATWSISGTPTRTATVSSKPTISRDNTHFNITFSIDSNMPSDVPISFPNEDINELLKLMLLANPPHITVVDMMGAERKLMKETLRRLSQAPSPKPFVLPDTSSSACSRIPFHSAEPTSALSSPDSIRTIRKVYLVVPLAIVATTLDAEQHDSPTEGLLNNADYSMTRVWSTRSHLSLDDIDVSHLKSLTPGLAIYEMQKPL